MTLSLTRNQQRVYRNSDLLEKDRFDFDDYDALMLNRKYQKFVDSLSKEELVVFSSMDLSRMFGELALAELNGNNDFKNSFERIEIEMLSYYYFRGASEEKIKEEFAEDFEPVNQKFYEYCYGIHNKGSKSLYNFVKLSIIKACRKISDHINMIRGYALGHWNSFLKKLRALGYTEQQPYPY